ncbi:MAG: hypothetical protein AB1458_13205 [Bacteroidota bacterium]
MARIICILLLALLTGPGSRRNLGLDYSGTYKLTDSSRYWCSSHTLTLYKDSAFEYYSPCLNTEGKWKANKGGSISLTSIPLQPYYVKLIKSGKSPGNITEVKLLGASSKTKSTPGKLEVISEKPVVCEEVQFISEKGIKTAFTNNQGEAWVDLASVDTIRFVTMSKTSKTDHFVALKGQQGQSITVFLNVDNQYHHYCEFKNLKATLQGNKLVLNKNLQDSTIIKDIPGYPFVKNK